MIYVTIATSLLALSPGLRPASAAVAVQPRGLRPATAAVAVQLRAAVSMQLNLEKTALAGAAKTASTVIEEVSKSSKAVAAPEAAGSFVAMDDARKNLVDEDGLPLVYDKDAIQAYWEGQGSALQQRWLEFLGETVPFLTKVAGLLISGGTEALEANAADLAFDARVNLEKLGPTYIKVRHAGP